MNIDNLEFGMVLKNYRELCEVLEIEPILQGKGKKLQEKDIFQYISFHKLEGSQKVMIDEIYETKKEKVDGRKLGSKSKYVNEVGDILVSYLYEKGKKENKYSTILSLGQTLEILGMVNKTYNIGCRHRYETAEVLDTNIFSVHYFFNNTRTEYRKIIERALKNLQNRRVLNWNKCVQICMNENNKKIYKKVTKEQEEYIINAEKRVLAKLGVGGMKELFFSGKIKKFQKLVKEQLPKEWLFYFYAYDLTIGDEAIQIEKKLIDQSKQNLNIKSKDKAIRLLKAEEGKDEYKLIEVLIDLLKYDFEIDEKIEGEYKARQVQKFIKYVHEDTVHTARLNDIEKEFEDTVEMVDYFNYLLSKQQDKELLNISQAPDILLGL